MIKDREKVRQPQLYQKEQLYSSCRRSARLQKYHYSCERENQAGPSLPANYHKQKGAHEVSESLMHPVRHFEKRQCKQLQPEPENLTDSGYLSKRPRTYKDRLIEHWTHNEYKWPKKPLELDSIEDYLARSRTRTPSLRSSKSTANLDVPSETSSREANTRPYTDKNYELYLETEGSYIRSHKDSISRESENFCQELLGKVTKIPRDTMFENDAFESICERLNKYNETGVVRIIGELIVPTAESAFDSYRIKFPHLVVSINKGWDSSIPLYNTDQQSPRALLSSQALQPLQSRPQPDYAVGFPRQAFTKDQLRKLAPFIGEIGDTSFFMGTAYMLFPFMTAEVKCGKTALDIADRQNAHSMTLSVRGIVKLFRLIKREKELHQQILAISISHDNRMVRIYGHYPVIDGEETSYYCHSIYEFSFIARNGRDKWTSYQFVMGIYDDWAPAHFKKLCSAIDQLPEINFELSQQSESSLSESTGLSQGTEGVDVQGSPGEEDQPTVADSHICPIGYSSNARKRGELARSVQGAKEKTEIVI